MCSATESCKCDKAWRAAWKYEQALRLELERQLVLHGAETAVIRKARDVAHERVGPVR